MHWETAIYICLQACTDLNIPRGLSVPDFPSLARSTSRLVESQGADARAKVLSFVAQTITVGHDDSDVLDDEAAFDPAHEYGWDVEHPKRELSVGAFKIDALPVTNGEYLEWLEKAGKEGDEALVPASWAGGKGARAVKTLYGEVTMAYAREWPVAASGRQLGEFAKVRPSPARTPSSGCSRLTSSPPPPAGQGRSPPYVRGAVALQPAEPRLAAARQRRLRQPAPGPADAAGGGARRLADPGDRRRPVDVDVLGARAVGGLQGVGPVPRLLGASLSRSSRFLSSRTQTDPVARLCPAAVRLLRRQAPHRPRLVVREPQTSRAPVDAQLVPDELCVPLSRSSLSRFNMTPRSSRFDLTPRSCLADPFMLGGARVAYDVEA